MIVHTKNLPTLSNALKVMLVWMDEKPMTLGRAYDIKRATSVVSGSFEHINYKIDVNTYERTEVTSLELNDIASCKMLLTRPIAADSYKENKETGSFIVVDRISNNTVGAGMIVGVTKRDVDSAHLSNKTYSDAEKALNKYIRDNFPEWECKEI